MKWSWRIARVAGIGIFIHATFPLLLAYIAVDEYRRGGTVPATIAAVAFILALFVIVVLHELGHALAARRYGIATRDITLLPIGGVARLERMPEKSGQEIVVALAGPAVNVLIALVLIVILNTRFEMAALQRLDNPALDFMVRLTSVNVFLVLFNLIPAFPMDGGRVLRALLALWFSRTQATNIAARIGQALAFVFGFLGLMGNPMLLFIAIFVYLAATAEARSVGLQDVSRQLGVGDAMITRFETLSPHATIGEAAELLLRTTQHEFPVVDGAGRLVGYLTRDAMVRALSKTGAATPVADAMIREVPTVASLSRLEPALRLFQERSVPAVAVIDWGGRLVGYITPENIGELMLVESAGLGVRPRRSAGPLLPQ
jgi:Zn-dependent protease/CBS domain-containing protein